MRIVKELNKPDRDALKIKHVLVNTYCSHIAPVIEQPYCFEIEIMPKDFEKIIIFLNGRNWSLAYQISLLINTPTLLQHTPSEIGFYGEIVINQINMIREFKGTPREYFERLLGCFMIDRRDGKRIYDVTDGQHRLLAYALATGVDERHFPINVYWGTHSDKLV